MSDSLGQVVFGFFEDHLKVQKGLRPGSIKSYRDTLKLFLIHVAGLCRRPITRLALSDLTFERVLDFLRMIEDDAQESGAYTKSAACRLAHVLSIPRCSSARDAGRSSKSGSYPDQACPGCQNSLHGAR